MPRRNSGIAAFMRDVLTNCLGTVMIEADQWDLPDNIPLFDRGYFNERLKHTAPINDKAHERLVFIFSLLFRPEGRKGRYQEPQAVDGANALISTINTYFGVDLSLWRNQHMDDNGIKRGHLIECLDNAAALCVGLSELPVQEIAAAISRYMEDVISQEAMPPNAYPECLTTHFFQPAEYYAGRENTANSITEHLLSGRSCYLHGIGGIGKTEIAKDVWNSIRNMPSSESGITHMAWIEYIEENLALSLVRSLPLKWKSENIEQRFQQAVSYINRYRQRFLLVVDNVENPDDERLLGISGYMTCRILVASRREGFPGLLEIPVAPLSMDDCLGLFLHYYHGRRDDPTLRKIIELADRHTVTVELLSKIADTEEVSLHEFYDSLVRCGFHISSEEASTAHGKMHTEGRIIEQLQKLFHVYGFKQDEERLLVQVSAIPSIPFLFDQAKKWFALGNRTLLNSLSKKGWLKKEALYSNARNRYQYIMHSVIASAVRAQFIDSLYEMCHGFIKAITTDMQQASAQNDDAKKKLIQFSWSLNDIFHDSFGNEDDCDFLWVLAETYRDIGYYERALPMLDSLHQLYAGMYGESCPHLGSVWNSRGMIAYELSHFDKSLECYRKSRSIYETKGDPSSLPVQARLDLAKLDLNIGKTYLKIDYTQAGAYFENAYWAFLEELGENHHLTVHASAHMAMLKAHTGCFEDAEKIYLDTYNRTSSDTDDREILLLRAGIAHNLGNLYSDYEPSKAMPYLEEARDIFSNLLSPTHPDTLDVLNTICSQELAQGINYEKSLDDFLHLLELFLKAYGPDDPNTGTIYNNIGLCHYYLRNAEEAIANYREAIRIDSISYGESHESIAYIYNNIGAVYSENGYPEKAISEHEHALRIYESAYPDKKNLDLAQTHSDMADAYLQLGDADKTMEHLNEAFAIYDCLLPEDARQYLMPCSTLANLLVAMQDYERAEEQYSHVIWLMLQNGYSEDSNEMKEFTARVLEVRQLREGIESQNSVTN